MKKNDVKSLAIGVFDGIHKGHKELFKKLDKNSALLIIEKDITTLTPFNKREEYSNLPCFYFHIKDIKNFTGEEFMELLKSNFPNLKKIVVGNDFKFGINRSATIKDLRTFFSGEIIEIDELCINNIGVHSSKIKEFLLDGNIKKANEFLGRKYSIVGKVIKGNGLGKKSLYPTINIESKQFLIPKDGIYASKIRLKNITYNSVTFIGKRISIDNAFSIETYVLDETEIEINLGDLVEIYFIDFIRNNKKFDKIDELKKQIQDDTIKAKEILENTLTCKV